MLSLLNNKWNKLFLN